MTNGTQLIVMLYILHALQDIPGEMKDCGEDAWRVNSHTILHLTKGISNNARGIYNIIYQG